MDKDLESPILTKYDKLVLLEHLVAIKDCLDKMLNPLLKNAQNQASEISEMTTSAKNITDDL